MNKSRIIILILLLVSPAFILNAQDDEVKIGLRAGHNVAFGGFSAVSVETVQSFCGNFSVNGGIQYNTIGKTVLEACPAYKMSFDWFKISVESMFTYMNLRSTNSFTAGVGATFDSKYLGFRLGYYYRLYCSHASLIKEPFNIYYELCSHLLQRFEDWNLDLIITNCEMFELERHYQPSFIIEGSYFPTSKLGISFGIGCKPSGMFNMSADYYQSFIKTGICYRW